MKQNQWEQKYENFNLSVLAINMRGLRIEVYLEIVKICRLTPKLAKKLAQALPSLKM